MPQGEYFQQRGPNTIHLDSGSEISLICQSHFKEHLLPRIETPMGKNADACVLFNLMAANDGQLPIKNIHRI